MSKKWLDEWLAEIYPSLIVYGRSLTHSLDEAEDLVQEAIYRFLLIYDTLDQQNHKGWLFRVMRNYYYDQQRQQKNKYVLQRQLQTESFITENPLNILLQTKEHQALYQAINHLENPYREVLISFYFLDMSIQNIATLTGLRINNIKVILYRGRKQIKEVLTNE